MKMEMDEFQEAKRNDSQYLKKIVEVSLDYYKTWQDFFKAEHTDYMGEYPFDNGWKCNIL